MSDITGWQAGEPCECGQTIVAYCPRDAQCRVEIDRMAAVESGLREAVADGWRITRVGEADASEGGSE